MNKSPSANHRFNMRAINLCTQCFPTLSAYIYIYDIDLYIYIYIYILLELGHFLDHLVSKIHSATSHPTNQTNQTTRRSTTRNATWPSWLTSHGFVRGQVWLNVIELEHKSRKNPWKKGRKHVLRYLLCVGMLWISEACILMYFGDINVLRDLKIKRCYSHPQRKNQYIYIYSMFRKSRGFYQLVFFEIRNTG